MEMDNTMARDLGREGLADWLLRMWRSRARVRNGRARRMQLLETLPVGGRRQLMLVRCGEEQFLVGGSADGISTIVKIDGGESERCQ